MIISSLARIFISCYRRKGLVKEAAFEEVLCNFAASADYYWNRSLEIRPRILNPYKKDVLDYWESNWTGSVKCALLSLKVLESWRVWIRRTDDDLVE